MTREEAIEVYNGLINQKIKEAFEFFAPELRESEDERIREELKEAFEAYDIESKWNGIPIRSILAWLEKQKEPHYTKRNALFDECVKNCDQEVMKEVSDKVDAMLEKEQKPEWSEEDVDMLNSCISSIEEAKENRYAYKETDGDTSYDHEIAWLKSLRPSWRPSEEQIYSLGTVVKGVENASVGSIAYNLKELYEQLKNL